MFSIELGCQQKVLQTFSSYFLNIQGRRTPSNSPSGSFEWNPRLSCITTEIKYVNRCMLCLENSQVCTLLFCLHWNARKNTQNGFHLYPWSALLSARIYKQESQNNSLLSLTKWSGNKRWPFSLAKSRPSNFAELESLSLPISKTYQMNLPYCLQRWLQSSSLQRPFLLFFPPTFFWVADSLNDVFKRDL